MRDDVGLGSLADFIALSFDEVWSLELDKPFNTGKKYAHSGTTCNGCRIAWNQFDGYVDYWLLVPGAVCAGLPVISEDSISLAHVVATLDSAFSFKCTRLDICLDDYSKIISIDAISDLIRTARVDAQGNDDPDGKLRHVSGVHDARIIESFSTKKPGKTCYFGAVGAPKILRAYDKFAQSGGEFDCNRFELQQRSYKAEQCFRLVAAMACEDIQKLPQFLGGFVVGSVNFVQFHEKNLDRCIRLSFWQAYVDAVQCCLKIATVKKIHTLQGKLDWIERSVSKTLAVLNRVFGRVVASIKIGEFVERAYQRFTNDDIAMIASSRLHLDNLRRNSDFFRSSYA